MNNYENNEDLIDKSVYEKTDNCCKKLQYVIQDVAGKNMSATTQI